MKIKCLLVDDEPIALTILAAYVQKIDILDLVGQCSSAVEAFTILQSKPVDLLFLDIQMPQLSGLDLLRTLSNPPKTIITSAYREYAVEGYELDVLDYLIKPIPFDRFIKAVGKMITQRLAVSLPNSQPDEEPFIFVKEDRKLVRVDLRDIISLESLRDYVKIRTSTQEIVTRQSISYYEELLPAEQFMRIHRSFLVALAKIRAITDCQLEVPGQTLPVGRNYRNQVLEQLQVRHFFRRGQV
ncbi:response regulator transcription factor [Spirosoma sp. KCTC 42546]|uniref:LytR/AlgR family response regulator transcription factor n=1 Tax=Spirosoma sp. KCTC 42546 TaxID=2520506 RepID=UPI001159ADDF|nr:LytTR family DNA-binding domain-containing protein [Spirosoma sp. KCTC 42546]QDK79984.1 response regulator transcription factor [Spirosoma sp. KCTC 42546]